MKRQAKTKRVAQKPFRHQRQNQEKASNGVDRYAIQIKNACLHYATVNWEVPVLQGITMNVPKGSIYGLLGPSGCGKTTLINCIVGKRRLVSGELAIFSKTGAARSSVSGARLGYMPQDLALVLELTVKETLRYFGSIFGMGSEAIESRLEFLIDLLDLPREDRLIVILSGGQQRRVSLAAALMHEPELLILDEPTVGVDPILRKCIWSHLVSIANASRATIIITTHFIDEARQANVIGMMRLGRILAEGSPNDLMLLYKKMTLEDVFMQLCLDDKGVRAQDEKEKDRTKNEQKVRCLMRAKQSSRGHNPEKESENIEEPLWSHLSYHRIMATLIVHVVRLKRNTTFLIFLFVLPSILFTVSYVAIGHNPRGMTIAIFNEDVSSLSCEDHHHTHGCILQNSFHEEAAGKANLGCRYLSYVDFYVLRPVFYDNLTVAEQAVLSGKHMGVIHFKENYTQALGKRFTPTIFIRDDDIFDQSDIHVILDMSNQFLLPIIQLHLMDAYQNFLQGCFASCKLNAKETSLPMAFEDINRGSSSKEHSIADFMAPGCVVTIIYYLSVGITAVTFITDKRHGVTDRGWVSGVKPPEVVAAFLIINFLIMSGQVILLLSIMMMVFQYQVKGSIASCLLLIILQGVCGMTFGMVLSASFDTEHEAMVIAISSLFSSLFLGGIVWPLEGMPGVLQYFSHLMPSTLAIEALRGVMSKGWGLDHAKVNAACLLTVSWILFHMLISVFVLQLKR